MNLQLVRFYLQKMKSTFSKILFILFLTVSGLAQAKTLVSVETLCMQSICKPVALGQNLYSQFENITTATLAIYQLSVDLSNEPCIAEKNCQLFLGAIGDAYRISINGHLLTDNLGSEKNYSIQDSTKVILPDGYLKSGKNLISISVRDLNGTLMGLLNSGVFVGSEFEVYRAQIFDWFLRTGITLFSAYTLIILALTIFLMLLIRFDLSILSIFIYCIVACTYLISFSEFPRKFFDPEIFSGTIHFFLRLLQDLCLFSVFHLVLNGRENKYIFKTIAGIYLLFISAFPIAFLLGFKTYATAKSIIFIGAPLVAMPMGYAFYLSYKLQKGFERSLLMPITFCLFALQVNDLLLFWQIVPSYFTVKFYIPAVVGLLIYIQIRRYVEDYSEKNRVSEKVILVKQVIHDIKSPVGALAVVMSKANLEHDLKDLADASFKRMNDLIRNLLFESLSSTELKPLPLDKILNNMIREKLMEYSDIGAQIEVKEVAEVEILGKEYDLHRIFSNIINNSVEACVGTPKITVSIAVVKKSIHLTIQDNGKGIPSEVISRIGTYGFSFGKDPDNLNSGLGLYSAKKTVRSWGGDLLIKSSVGQGTEISLVFPKINPENKRSRSAFSGFSNL